VEKQYLSPRGVCRYRRPPGDPFDYSFARVAIARDRGRPRQSRRIRKARIRIRIQADVNLETRPPRRAAPRQHPRESRAEEFNSRGDDPKCS